jgi:hypothetical protein
MSSRKNKKDQDGTNAAPGEIVERADSGEPEGRLSETTEDSFMQAEPHVSTQATETAAPSTPSVERRSVELPRHWPATLLILVVAAFLIGGLAAYWPQLSGQAGGDRIAALEARIAELTPADQAPAAAGIPAAVQRRVESIETRLGTLERNAPAIFNEQAGATLDQRVTTLETARTETGQAVSALVARLATVEAATPADLPQRLQSFASGAALANVEQRVTTLEALRHAAAVLALARLARAADEARPYLREFRALQTVAPEDPAIVVLEPYAESGIPTMAMLAARFPDAARIAISAERTGMADGFWSRLWARFRNMVSIRRIALGPGNDSESRLARAQAVLGEDNLAGAVEEVAALEGDAATAIAPWLREARARLAIDRAIREMDERVTQVLALRAPMEPTLPENPATSAPANPAPAAPVTPTP